MIPLPDLKKLLGIPQANTTYDDQVMFALEAVTALIQGYTGRQLIRAQYAETFHGRHRRWRNHGDRRHLSLLEYPVNSLISIVRDGQALSVGDVTLHHSIGILWFSGIESCGEIVVEYDGGYGSIPADLRAVALSLISRQLSSMGVDLSAVGGATPGSAPVSSIAIGQLRVGFAVAADKNSTSAASIFSPDALEEFSSVLNLYVSSYRLAALPS